MYPLFRLPRVAETEYNLFRLSDINLLKYRINIVVFPVAFLALTTVGVNPLDPLNAAGSELHSIQTSFSSVSGEANSQEQRREGHEKFKEYFSGL